jgi:DNA processing protein
MQNMRFIATTDLPENLQQIPDKPKQGLHVKGDPWPDHLKRLCVVGSRKPTDYGQATIEQLFSGLSGHSISIISGLALGIDATAHRLALKYDLHTVAFPGSGLDQSVLYPATNKSLATEILKQGGGLVSEYDPKQKSAQWTFPRRNWLMAGLSDAVLVIEATQKSGTLITARLALDYNRDVLAVPGSIFSANSAGPHSLINDGAKLIQTADDILEALGIQTGVAKSIDLTSLSTDEQLIYRLIKSEPRTKDEIIKLSKLDTTRALSVITMLELKNLTQEKLGKVYLK